MLKKIREHFRLILASILFIVPLALPATSFATVGSDGGTTGCGDNISNGISTGVNDTTGQQGTCANTSNTSVQNTLANIASLVINVFSIIVGVISVLMIIYGGFKYVTSGGDSNHVSGAKNTLIYAIIGLVIVAIAQLIVHFVLNEASTVTASTIYYLR